MRKVLIIAASVVIGFFNGSHSHAQTTTAERFLNGASDVVLEINDSGIATPVLKMKMRQGMIFFYNDTADALLTLDVDFGENALACFSSVTPNLEFRGQHLVSTRPIAPGDFASTCFPGMGDYQVMVFGLPAHPQGVKGKIEVLGAG